MKVEAAALRIGFEQPLSGLDQAVLSDTMPESSSKTSL